MPSNNLSANKFCEHLWDSIIDSRLDPKWIDEWISRAKRHPKGPFADAGLALERLIKHGASQEDLGRMLRHGAYEAVFATLYALDDPGVKAKGRGALYESLLSSDPSSRSGSPESTSVAAEKSRRGSRSNSKNAAARSVFELRPDYNHFQHFLFDEVDQLLDIELGAQRISDWRSPKPSLENRRRPAGDFYHFDCNPMIINERAKAALEKQLASVAQLLPITYLRKKYYVVNVTAVVDCLDRRKTGWKKTDLDCENPIFVPAKLGPAPLFRIPQILCRFYARESFVDAIEKAGLKGLIIKKIWEED